MSFYIKSANATHTRTKIAAGRYRIERKGNDELYGVVYKSSGRWKGEIFTADGRLLEHRCWEDTLSYATDMVCMAIREPGKYFFTMGSLNAYDAQEAGYGVGDVPAAQKELIDTRGY